MTGEPMLNTSEERWRQSLLSSERTPQLSITDSKVKWSLCFAFSYVHSNYLKLKWPLHFAFTARYTAFQTKNSMRSVSSINPVATENMGDKNNNQHKAVSCYRCELTPCVVSKKNWNTKEGNDACIVHIAVGENAHLGMKKH